MAEAMRWRRGPTWLLSTALVLGMTLNSAVLAAGSPAQILFTRFATSAAFGGGVMSGVTLDSDRLVLVPGASSGMWLSPPVQPGFPFSRLVASWNAETPADGRVRIDARVTTAGGESSDWYALGAWAADDHAGARTSIDGQADALGKVDTDTLSARAEPFLSYLLRVRLDRTSADDPSPSLRLLGAAVSAFTYTPATPTSAPLGGEAIELAVAPLSQEVHARQYPQWGGGGEAWCSPTSTEMVVEYWGRGPSADDLAWVDPSFADPGVVFAARATYDAAYRGTGNWPFNTAYAGRFGLEAFVTQLRSLAEAEKLVRAGIPVIASIAAGPGELDGFLLSGGTNGHLVVIVGFDATGRPIVNDPAAWNNGGVRRVYDRGQFERAWQRGSAGTVYVIHPAEVALPPPEGATPNW